MMTCYLDDSGNQQTVSCGGWIGFDSQWDKIGRAWSDRVAYEDRVNRKKGLNPITRFHAADCSNAQGDFSGWNKTRQLNFYKRLIQIMKCATPLTKCSSIERPMIFGWAASLSEAMQAFPELTPFKAKEYCYLLCVSECFKEIALVMREYYHGERITFVHDRGSTAKLARKAFEAIAQPRSFIALVDLSWEDCVQLQCADMVAYEIYKRLDGHLIGKTRVRKSLQALVDANTPIVAGVIKSGGFKTIRSWMEQDGIL